MINIGDVACCVDKSVIITDTKCCTYSGEDAPPLRSVGRVVACMKLPDCSCVILALDNGYSGYIARFRKVDPASPEFIARIRSLRPGRVREDV